jgi:hypothetical protein
MGRALRARSGCLSGSVVETGLAAALHSGDPAFDGLPDYLMQRLEPVPGSLRQAQTAL